MSKIAITIGTVLLPGIAAAHPDHAAGSGFGAAHYLGDPFHVGWTLAGILIAVVAGRSLLGLRARAVAGRRLHER